MAQANSLKPLLTFVRVIIGTILVLIGILIGALLFSGTDPLFEDLTGYFTNLYTEAVSVILTIGVLNFLAERREDQRRERDFQERLVMDAGSQVHATAVTAVNTMRKRGWLKTRDATQLLVKAYLNGANLSGAELFQANLSGTNLLGANLSGANLRSADLSSAELWEVNLSGANLDGANLSGANLDGANLSGADLRSANLSGARLQWADLSGAKFGHETFLSYTTLPDGKLWSDGDGLARLRAAGAEWDADNPPYEVDHRGNPITPGGGE